MARTLTAVAAATHGRLVGADASFGAVSTDTRTFGMAESAATRLFTSWER